MNLPTIKSEAYAYEFVPADVDELVRWCRVQAGFYKKIADNNNGYRNEYAFSELKQQISSAVDIENLAGQIQAAAAQPEPNFEAQIASLQSKSEQLFNQFGLPPADSEVGLQLSEHLEVDPSVAYPALYALCKNPSQSQHAFQTNLPSLWRGLGIGSSLSLLRTQKQRPPRYAKAVRDWVSSAQADLARTRSRAELTVRDLRGNVSDFKQKVIDFETQHSSRLETTTAATEKLLSETQNEIEKFKYFVKSEIALKAPVTYWETKAAEHETRAFFFGIGVFILMFLGGVGAFHSISFVREIVGAGDKTNYAGVAVVAVLVTLTFWALRLVVRLFLSQQHLGADARERTAMVKTYLALKEAGVAPKDGDLTPVLVALFRTSSDGIVKDEAMPPVLAEILTRTKN